MSTRSSGLDASPALDAQALFADPGNLISEWARTAEGSLASLAEAGKMARSGRLGGVFLIGFGGALHTAILVGQSDDIADDLGQLALHPQISAFAQYGGLSATWLTMPAPFRAGVERYLTETLTPIMASKCPLTEAYPVSIPVEFGGKSRRDLSILS